MPRVPKATAMLIGMRHFATGSLRLINRMVGQMATDDDMDRYWMPPTASSINSGAKRQAVVTSQVHPGRNRSNWIAQRARMVLGAYRKDDFADPDSFLLQLGMVLERYDDGTIEHATSPLTGIQRESKFPPTIAEMVEFCDEVVRRQNYTAQYDAR